MKQNNNSNWRALYVATNCEKVIGAKLSEIGIETCVPTTKIERQWKDRVKVLDKVLFPNYVFLYLPSNKLDLPLAQKHVVSYVKFGSEIAILSERDINLIKSLIHYPNQINIVSNPIAIGDRVEIISGPLKSRKGRIVSFSQSPKIQLEIAGLRSFAIVTIRKSEVRKLVMT